MESFNQSGLFINGLLKEDEFWPWLVIAVPIWMLTYYVKVLLSQESQPMKHT